jgi:hypothetical protein
MLNTKNSLLPKVNLSRSYTLASILILAAVLIFQKVFHHAFNQVQFYILANDNFFQKFFIKLNFIYFQMYYFLLSFFINFNFIYSQTYHFL